MFFYAPRMGFLKGLYFSLFHSISAFCTAGFDLMGYYEPSSSLITANTDILLNVVLILLLNVGGIGFLTWDDIVRNKWHFKKYRVQSKIIIVVTVIFYVIGVAEMLLVERNNALAVTDNYNEKFLIASMLVTSGRDAGFSPIDISTLKPASILMMICFMFIGGAPGSTACGIKTTTFAVMVLTIVCVYRRKKHVECFGRRIESSAIRDASCVMTLYLIVVIVSTILICAIDDLELVPVLFEVVSAISSCGLSMGITTQLSDISCALITLIMFFGRIGGITFIVSLSSSSKQSKVVLPEEKIFIG
jgi:trk system potassium uptake protein TrkH